ILDKTLIEIDEAQERLHLFLIRGRQPSCDPIHLDRIHLHLTLRDNQAKVLDLGLLKLALVLTKVEFDEARDATVLFNCVSEDEDVVKIDADNAFKDEVMENVIHHGLKGGRTISKAKEHDKQFKKTMVGMKGCLPLISLLYPHIIVAPMDVKLGEVSGSMELVHEFRDVR
ncbi:hypothetical protein L208DRAFT_1258496, partial [Tricholoma matsutake]